MTRVYETYIEVEDDQELGNEIYAMELEQCNVVYEKIELQDEITLKDKVTGMFINQINK